MPNIPHLPFRPTNKASFEAQENDTKTNTHPFQTHMTLLLHKSERAAPFERVENFFVLIMKKCRC